MIRIDYLAAKESLMEDDEELLFELEDLGWIRVTVKGCKEILDTYESLLSRGISLVEVDVKFNPADN